MKQLIVLPALLCGESCGFLLELRPDAADQVNKYNHIQVFVRCDRELETNRVAVDVPADATIRELHSDARELCGPWYEYGGVNVGGEFGIVKADDTHIADVGIAAESEVIFMPEEEFKFRVRLQLSDNDLRTYFNFYLRDLFLYLYDYDNNGWSTNFNLMASAATGEQLQTKFRERFESKLKEENLMPDPSEGRLNMEFRIRDAHGKKIEIKADENLRNLVQPGKRVRVYVRCKFVPL